MHWDRMSACRSRGEMKFGITAQALILSLVLVGVAGTASSETCLLIVDGQTIIDGPCDYWPISDDGTFQISSLDGSVFAQLSRDARPDLGIGYWNETPGASHAHTTIGDLKREGACWVNTASRICAWR